MTQDAARESEPVPSDDAAMFRAIVDHSSELVVVTDAIGTIRYASPSASTILGYSVSEYEGRNVVEMLHPDEVTDANASLATTAAEGGVKEPLEVRLRQADGSYRSFEIIATNLLDDPDVEGIVLHGRDLTDRLDQQRRFRLFFEQSPIASAFIRVDGTVFANQAFAHLVGYSREELLHSAIKTLLNPVDYRHNRATIAAAFRARDESATFESRWVRKDATEFWGRSTGRLLLDETGQPESIFVAVTDITAERASRAALEDSERRYRAIVDNSTDIIAVLQPDGHWTASDAGTRQLGYPKGFDPEGGVFSLVHPDELGTAAEALAEVLDGRRGPMDTIMLRLRGANGDYHYFECVGQNLGDDADVGGVVITARNVDRRRQLEEQLQQDATHDALTGLLNRAAFMVAAERGIARHQRTTAPLAVMFIDLDRFKQVNDTLGHAAGDHVLVEVARRIEGCVRSADTIARLGGDEFVVLCEDLDTEERAIDIAERIVRAVEQRIFIEDREAFVGASVGIAFAQPAQSASELLRDADAAVYRAKRDGRARVERFDEAMRADTAARVSIEVDLRHALERGEIEVEYQPVIAVAHGTVEAFHARAVWRRGDEVLRGAAIRSLADEAGLGRLLGERLLHTAAIDLTSWIDAGLPHVDHAAIRLYLSPTTRHLLDRAFATDFGAAFTSIAPELVCIGVPEEWLADDTDAAANIMSGLRERGVRIAVNGFGRAHSSLADLRKLPLDIIRLDPKFAFGLAVDAAGAAIVNAVIGLASALDRRVLADGIDEVEHLAALFNLGCAFATGALLAPPVNASEAGSLFGSIPGESLLDAR